MTNEHYETFRKARHWQALKVSQFYAQVEH